MSRYHSKPTHRIVRAFVYLERLKEYSAIQFLDTCFSLFIDLEQVHLSPLALFTTFHITLVFAGSLNDEHRLILLDPRRG
jgi:hypothetical protein